MIYLHTGISMRTNQSRKIILNKSIDLQSVYVIKIKIYEQRTKSSGHSFNLVACAAG
jgi:hypothetical protein